MAKRMISLSLEEKLWNEFKNAVARTDMYKLRMIKRHNASDAIRSLMKQYIADSYRLKREYIGESD